jgi:hypothetical protein
MCGCALHDPFLQLAPCVCMCADHDRYYDSATVLLRKAVREQQDTITVQQQALEGLLSVTRDLRDIAAIHNDMIRRRPARKPRRPRINHQPITPTRRGAR